MQSSIACVNRFSALQHYSYERTDNAEVHQPTTELFKAPKKVGVEFADTDSNRQDTHHDWLVDRQQPRE